MEMIAKRLGRIEVIKNLSTTNSKGNDIKWFCKYKGKFIYVKACTTKQGGRNYEAEAECVACRLAEMLGVNCVKYIIDTVRVKENNRVSEYVVSISPEYGIKNGRTPLARMMKKDMKLQGLNRYNCVMRNFPTIEKDINKMLVFDYIIGNSDRHLNNIEIVDNYGVNEMAPLFDNGDSLFSKESIREIKIIFTQKGNYVKSKPFINPHIEQIKLTRGKVKLNKVNIIDVYKLVNTYFKGDRAKLINKWLKTRLEELGLCQ